MVNTGKPSRGCYMCRARRIKCDEGKPSCMRCQKSKRICPGYRDAFELKLRDESKSTKKKLARRTAQDTTQDAYPINGPFLEPLMDVSMEFTAPAIIASGLTYSRSQSISSVSSYDGSYDSSGSSTMEFHRNHGFIATHMATPIHQQAACYFLANFVLIPEEGTMRGYLDFILPLLKKRDPSPALLNAFSAVALAALGTRPNSKALLPKADLWYLNALKEINRALQDPATASSESTLASVMLLASFEQLVPSRMKVGGWASHIDGAVAVIKSLPMAALKGKLFRDLFLAVRAHMTIQCIANAKSVDESVDWSSISTPDEVTQRFAEMNIRMAALRADNDLTTTLQTRTTENLEKVLKLLRRAEALEREYVAWIETLPPNWNIKTVAWIDSDIRDLTESIVHPGRVDAYGELWMAYFYNIVRACRLFIWTTILRCAAWINNPQDYRLAREYTTAAGVCRQIIEDIIASVPYFFGWNRSNNMAMADKSNFACGLSGESSIKGLAGIFAMWPIFAAAASDFASQSQRIYLRGRLKYIAEMMGINQAVIMLDAQLLHPSIYIARERMNMKPTTCTSTDTEISNIGSPPKVIITIPGSSSPSQMAGFSHWIPRSFGEENFMKDTIMSQEFNGYKNREHERADSLLELRLMRYDARKRGILVFPSAERWVCNKIHDR